MKNVAEIASGVNRGDVAAFVTYNVIGLLPVNQKQKTKELKQLFRLKKTIEAAFNTKQQQVTRAATLLLHCRQRPHKFFLVAAKYKGSSGSVTL